MTRIERFVISDSGYGYRDGSGDGSGYGYRDGSGDGSGDGYGDGSGDGYGDGSGDGSGYGYGDGSGYGYGDGYGDGSGDGYGYGSGDGYGDGIRKYCKRDVYDIDEIPTVLDRVNGTVAKGWMIHEDLTSAVCWVAKNGCTFAHGETLREAVDALREKLLKKLPAQERIDVFLQETKPGKAYPRSHFWEWHHRLTGSCEMGRKAFAKDHGLDPESGEMTLEEFCSLTKDTYGGDVIQSVMERIGLEG